MSFTSIPAHFFQTSERHPDAVGYAEKVEGSWVTTTWAAFADEVREVARALIGLGVRKGGRVAIMAFNRPAYTLADVGAMAAGAVPTGVYTNCAAPQMAYILGHAEAEVLFVDSADAIERISVVQDQLDKLRHVILMRGCGDSDHPLVMTWEAFLAHADGISQEQVGDRLSSLEPDDLACLIYTSGTTGPPKGSMLSHGNLTAATIMGGELIPGVTAGSKQLSYLPMAHAAERALSILGPAMFGYGVYYAESIEAMPANLREVRPTIFMGVPRVWEKMVAGMTAKLAKVSGPKAALVTWARRVAAEANELKATGQPVGVALSVQLALARKLVLGKVLAAIGLDQASVFISGAAPLSADNMRFLASMDIPIREVYGQTENCGPTTHNHPGDTRWGTVGKPYEKSEVRLADDGEILVRGPHIFLGYFKEPEATAEVIKDGWLHSGDIGVFDEDGFLTITGRKKEIIITAGGKNISRNLEEAIKRHPLIEEAVVVGDRRKYLTALLTLDRAAAESFVRGLGEAASQVATDAMHRLEHIIDNVWSHVSDINIDFSRAERVKKIGILPRSLTVENGELTPTLKVRRSVIQENHADSIEALYAEEKRESEIGIGPPGRLMIWKRDIAPADLDRFCENTLVDHLGILFTEVGEDFLKATMPVDARTLQPAGRLHGGATMALMETLGSAAAFGCVDPRTHECVGIEINANHIRSARSGHVVGTARPIHLGRSTQVWSTEVHDEEGGLVSTGRITVAVIGRKG